MEGPSSSDLRQDFLLDPNVIFLNHGSFGACPRPVFEAYQGWQRELERQPVEFLGRRFDALMAEARASLADYLGADGRDVVFVPNATTGVNIVARSLPLRAGDEVLCTDHEYGACERTWQYVCAKVGARCVRKPVRLPLNGPEQVVESVWSGVTEHTRVLFISHITSPTALVFPIEELVRRAGAAGILTVVDGAHAPGQVDLDLAALGADFYTGNLHKWALAPKGAGFLYVAREHQRIVEPLVISWGWESDTAGPSRFQDWHGWQGTRDISAYLAVPAALRFMAEHDWHAVRARCQALALDTRAGLTALTGLPPICPNPISLSDPKSEIHNPQSVYAPQMFSALLPDTDLAALKTQLYDEFRVEVPLLRWNGLPLIRVSIQAYNTEGDANALLEALSRLL